MFLGVTLGTAEITTYLLLKLGVAPRTLELVRTEEVPNTEIEIDSIIESKIKYVWKYHPYQEMGEANWPLHTSINNITQLIPSQKGEFIRYRRDGGVMHKYVVTTDSVGRRMTTPLKRKKHALIMGCSYVFGEGVSDVETIPEYIQKQTNEFRSYNLGYSGHTVDDIYIRAKDYGLMDNISETEGVAIYIAMGDHVRRSFGAMRDDWRLDKAKVVESKDGDFVVDGNHRMYLKGWRWILYYFANSHFAQFFDLDYPLVTDSKVEGYVRKILALKKLYQKKFLQKNHFYVVLYPDHFDGKTRNLIRKYLNIYKIEFVDYSKYNLDQFVSYPDSRLKDGHPSKLSNEAIAQILIEDLKLR